MSRLLASGGQSIGASGSALWVELCPLKRYVEILSPESPVEDKPLLKAKQKAQIPCLPFLPQTQQPWSSVFRIPWGLFFMLKKVSGFCSHISRISSFIYHKYYFKFLLLKYLLFFFHSPMMIITQKITSLAYEIHDGKNLEISLSSLKKPYSNHLLFERLLWLSAVC